MGESLADDSEAIAVKLSCFFIGEEIDAGKGGSLVQTAQLLELPIPVADVGLYQVS